MIDGYRIRVIGVPSGEEYFSETYSTEGEWQKAWEEDITTDDALSVYIGWGKIVLKKERMTLGGNWEVVRAEPMEITQVIQK